MQDESMVKDILNGYRADSTKAVNHLKGEYAVVKAGRANPHILDKVCVDYYGSPTPITQMASVSVPEARMILVNLWDASAMNMTRKALQIADLGVSITDDGKVFRLIFPTLTEERRKDIVKQIKSLAEETRISIRSARKDCMEMLKDLKKNSEISEDELTTLEKEVQKITDSYNGEVDTISTAKEKEVMEI